MNIQKFTQKSIEAVQNAQSLTIENGNQQMEEAHLFASLLKNPEELVSSILQKAGADVALLRRNLQNAIDRLPKVSGGGLEADKIYISRDLENALNAAEK